MNSDSVPIVTLCGFLGSGKTTLLRRWRRDEALKDAPVIVHDLSEFGLDAELLSDENSKPSPGHLVGGVAALHGRHAREQLHDSAGEALEEISALEPAPPLVLCESTGAARPWPLIKALTQNKRFFLRHFIVTVDALNLHRDFEDGKILTGAPANSQDMALRHVAEVLAEQIAFASVIILTKIDTVPKPNVEAQVKTLQALQPQATIGLSAQAGILLPQLEATPAPKLSVLESRANEFGLTQQSATVDSVDAIVIRDPRPFHPERLYEACRSKMGTGLYRTKGFLWLASRPRDVLLWQQSGSQIGLELTGLWRAELAHNRDGKLLAEEIEHLKALLKTKHPLFGDRHNELTLIGLKADRESFASSLQDAFCTDNEISAWQRGETFPDPWPSSLRQIK
ncbi:GTP-binding protein [Akkermansiaceae bacterium]|jgi:G3E family GTPase|nr:GTP-binding protein [Akkermansiaceae bacterium]MDB4622660.1 GTP-binding protein [Akkermansiaceae bacterium]